MATVKVTEKPMEESMDSIVAVSGGKVVRVGAEAVLLALGLAVVDGQLCAVIEGAVGA